MKKAILILSIFFSLSSFAQQYPIVLDIPDVVINETILKRKASLFTMTYNISKQYVALAWEVTYYSAKDDGSYGDEISFIPKYTKESVADNSTKVDSTGKIVYPDSSGNYPPGSIGQFDYFNNMAENTPILVNYVIKQYGEAIKEW